jgi:phosphoribosylanthranilate isomerase
MNCALIKVCGMRDAENIREVEALGIDLMGFIFWPKSSRYVSERPSYLPKKCKRVGVFVNEDIEQVKHIAADYALDYIQLHGSESPGYVQQLHDWQVIKAISVSSRDDIATFKDYEGLVDYFLFDTKCTCMGGSGQQFDWSVLDSYDGNTPFLLSGGIGPDDAERVKAFHHGKCIGIDLNSKFELSPALKDINKLQEFIKELSI